MPLLQGVVDRHAEADFGGVVVSQFSKRRASGRISYRSAVGPRRGMQVEERRLQLVDEPAGGIEEAGAARPAQVFTPGGG